MYYLYTIIKHLNKTVMKTTTYLELAVTSSAKITVFRSSLVDNAYILQREYTKSILNRAQGEKEQFMLDEDDITKIANLMGFDVVRKS